MLPAGGCQELFTTLYKVYPQPLDVKRSKGIRKHYSYGSWQKFLLDGASELSQHCSYYFFPRQPQMADFEQQLLMVKPSGIPTENAPSDGEKAKILQVCCNQCSVSTGHINFLEKLQRCLLEKSAPLQFEMQLFLAMVSNCVHHDWNSRDKFSHLRRGRKRDLIKGSHVHGDHSLCDCLLTSDDLGFSLVVLRDMWKFSIAPQAALELLEAVQGRASPQSLDIMCDILISALDCEASLQLRIFSLMIKIGAKPEHMLRAVNIASYSFSDSKQSSNQHRTAAIQCAEALGKSYNDHKATGTDPQMLLELRIKALNLLQQVKSIPVDSPVLRSRHWLHFMLDMQSCSATVNLEAVMQVVCDTGQQALTDLLALVVLLPGEFLLPTLKGMNALRSYYHKETDTSEDEPLLLKLPPFNETISALLENRKSKIKQLADFHEVDRIKRLVGDLKASFQFLGDEEGLTNFASFLHNGSLAHICNWEIPLHTEDGDDEDSGHEPPSL